MIEDRPLSEFELDCIVEAQMRLKDDKLYLDLKNKVLEANKDMSKEMLDIMMLNYEYGFFNGEKFALVKLDKLREIQDAENK
jgi:hypothetical protein